MGEKWKPGKMHTEYCLGGLSEEEQRKKGLYSVNRLSVFKDAEEYQPKCPFKDVDFSKLTEKAVDPFAGMTPIFPYKGSPLEELKDFLTPPNKDEIEMTTPQPMDMSKLDKDPMKGWDPFAFPCEIPHQHDMPQFKLADTKCNPVTPESTRLALAEMFKLEPPPPRRRRRRPSTTSTDPGTSTMTRAQKREKARKKKRELYAAKGKCLTEAPLSPFCQCSKLGGATSSCCRYDMPLPDGAFDEHHHNIVPIWLAYLRQARQSHCSDVDDHPGSCLGGASIAPLPPSMDFNNKAKLPMELAHRAIQEYNEKESNVFKYQVLKIEKVNLSLQGTTFQYWMTVKVLNLTLATPIETFQVHGGLHFMNDDEKVIYCFRPKEEEIVGLPSCDVCFGKLRGEEEPLGLEEGDVRKGELPEKFLVHLNRWNDDDFIPKAALKEHREEFRRIYGRYFRQIFQSDGFDFDIFPGDAKEAVYIPYLDFEKEADMLLELANHAIRDYNNRETVYKYKVSYIEKVNFSVAECREFYMTVKVINLTLRTPLETFQIHAYKGPHEENVVRLCRKKGADMRLKTGLPKPVTKRLGSGEALETGSPIAYLLTLRGNHPEEST